MSHSLYTLTLENEALNATIKDLCGKIVRVRAKLNKLEQAAFSLQYLLDQATQNGEVYVAKSLAARMATLVGKIEMFDGRIEALKAERHALYTKTQNNLKSISEIA